MGPQQWVQQTQSYYSCRMLWMPTFSYVQSAAPCQIHSRDWLISVIPPSTYRLHLDCCFNSFDCFMTPFESFLTGPTIVTSILTNFISTSIVGTTYLNFICWDHAQIQFDFYLQILSQLHLYGTNRLLLSVARSQLHRLYSKFCLNFIPAVFWAHRLAASSTFKFFVQPVE